MGQLSGKVAYVTGVARGQGRAEAIALARAGADIVGIDIAAPVPGTPYDPATQEDLEETRALIEGEDRRAILEQADVRDLDAQKSIVAAAQSELGGLDIVVANAGICIPATWDATTPQVFQDTMDINVTGVWNTVMAAAPALKERGGGSIVVTSSYAGKKVQPFMVHYTTSKHALVGMTRSFAAELGPLGIRVNSVHPGAVATPMGSGNMQQALETAGESNPRLKQMGTPFLDLWALDPEDIANAVLFLVSDSARGITSEHLSIDAGTQYF